MSSGKFGRGGGRGPSRMVTAPPPLGRGAVPLRRPGMMKDKGRMGESKGLGGGIGSGNNGSGVANSSAPSQEENFELKLGTGDLYAMAIRITPGFIETLKRVQEQGGETQIKFSQHQGGAHVIRAGDEEIRFSSAPEPGELCDIFEEKRRPEDGTGLLVESGSVWRKLSVQRTLSASEKDRVKMRSVEAERQQKSRKAIILDHNMNSKAVVPGDVNGRRPPPINKGKKEPLPKKRKIETVPTPTPPGKVRPGEKSSPSVPASKAIKPSASPEPTQSVSRALAAVAQVASTPLNKGRTADEAGPSAPQKTTPVALKDKVLSPAPTTGNEAGNSTKATGVVNMNELRNCLITLLADNPKGMTIKAVEKAFGESMPNVRPDKKQIEKVIKVIASYHAPGKYMLREGVEKGSFAKPSPGSGSSPDTPADESLALEETPSQVENTQEAAPETGQAGTPGDSGVKSQPDTRKSDELSRSSSHPLQRGGENAVTRAIRKAGEKYAERSQHEQEKTGIDSDRQSQQEVETNKDSTANLELVEVEHVDIDIGGDESPVCRSPGNEQHEKSHGIDVTSDEPKHSPPHGVDSKKETSDGSESSSASDSDSDTNSGSASGSGSGSGSGSDSESESDSDGSSSSASEDEKEDEDVRIVSDDEDNGGGNVPEGAKQNQKPKDAKTAAVPREDGRPQKPASRNRDHQKQKQKGEDASASPHESEDVDISDGEEGQMAPASVSAEKIECLGGADDMEVDIDVISCDGGNVSPQELGEASPAESEKDNVKAASPDATPEQETKAPEAVHVSTQPKGGSESDHSIEEYETRAETSGVRRAPAKGDNKDETGAERSDKKDDALGVTSPSKGKGSVEAKALEPSHRVQREIKPDLGALQPSNKGRDAAKEAHTSPGLPKAGPIAKVEPHQKSLLGTPPFPRENLDQGRPRTHNAFNRPKVVAESKKGGRPKDADPPSRFSRPVESGEMVEKISETPPVRPTVRTHTNMRNSKFSDITPKPLPETGTGAKSMQGLAKLTRVTDDSGARSRGTDTEPTVSDVMKSSRDGEAPERPDVQRKTNRDLSREPGLLGRPGKDMENPGKVKELEQISGPVREKDGNGLTRPIKDTKQVRKPYEKPDGFRRNEFADRAASVTESAEKPAKDVDSQRRMSTGGDSWRKSPKDMGSVSRVGNDSELQPANSKDARRGDADIPDGKGALLSDDRLAKEKESRLNSDLELGELRDIVAGEDLKGKETQRNDGGKWRETADGPSRQLPGKAHVSPDKEKLRKVGKQGPEQRKSSQAEAKKQVSRPDVQSSVRDTVRTPSGPQKSTPVAEERPDRSAEGNRGRGAYGDQVDKSSDAKIGKRSADDAGMAESGRPPKRPVSGPPQLSSSAGPESGKQDKSAAATGIRNQLTAVNSTKGATENGRVKSRGQEFVERVVPERRGPVEQRSTAGLLGPGSRRETPRKDLSLSNGVRASSLVEVEWFAPYEKQAPELRGPIKSLEQYDDYGREFSEKYACYMKLFTCLESDKDDFQDYRRRVRQCKAAEDKNSLQNIYSNVRNDFKQCNKRYVRMSKLFTLLHEELKMIKQRCREYREEVGQG